MFVPLRKSLVDICSFDDLMQRMMSYLSLDTCKEIFKTMTEVTKNAAIVIQSHFRKLRDRRNYLRMINAVHFLQTVVRAWLIANSCGPSHEPDYKSSKEEASVEEGAGAVN
ncbi:hypothetical protein ACFE04_022483 [Oxalis oulophora]